MHIVGTAGHVDHGKSALVQSLTGVNPDRWAQELERGMTLDLGFARLRFADGLEAGLVDVPGHERFLHNMLAGASGMELLLLVVAANEGVMPQTVEHVRILSFLNVARTIVVVTKSDLFDASGLATRIEGIREELSSTIAAGAPIVAVSNVDGNGLDALRLLIHEELEMLAARDIDAPVYLPIDRVFALPGRGTIVTGTLMQGRISVGDELALEPLGERVRVRTLHVFGESRDIAYGGSRVALNLPGVERSSVTRGEVVSDAHFHARTEYRVRFTPLQEALPLLRKRTPVRAHVGSSEVMATLYLSVVPQRAEAVSATLRLREPVLAFPGVRFVVRRPSPKTLLGGGEIEALAIEDDSHETESAAQRAVASALRESGTQPLDASVVAFKTNLREDLAVQTLDAMVESGVALKIARPAAYFDGGAARELLARITASLQSAHDAEPWSMGWTSIQLARSLALAEPLLVRLLATFVEDGRIAQRAGYYALVAYEPRLSGDQRAFFDDVLARDPSQPHVPVPFADVVAGIKSNVAPGLQKAFDTLLARGSLVKVGDYLYRGPQIATIHAILESFIERNGRMSMADFRDLLGTSRKYAVPLLEWFDSRGITVRSGDFRMLRLRRT